MKKEHVWVTTTEAMRLSGLSRQGVIDAAEAGRLPLLRVGKLHLIDAAAAAAYVKARRGRKKTKRSRAPSGGTAKGRQGVDLSETNA